MLAGKLDRRITLQKLNLGTPDAMNYATETFTDIGVVWANVTNVKGDEVQGSSEIKGRITKKFKVRYSSDILDISTTGRVVFDGVTYEIDSPAIEIGRREGLEFTATSRSEI
jgi:SPP1 family predicted phage head-tail adaptor